MPKGRPVVRGAHDASFCILHVRLCALAPLPLPHLLFLPPGTALCLLRFAQSFGLVCWCRRGLLRCSTRGFAQSRTHVGTWLPRNCTLTPTPRTGHPVRLPLHMVIACALCQEPSDQSSFAPAPASACSATAAAAAAAAPSLFLLPCAFPRPGPCLLLLLLLLSRRRPALPSRVVPLLRFVAPVLHVVPLEVQRRFLSVPETTCCHLLSRKVKHFSTGGTRGKGRGSR